MKKEYVAGFLFGHDTQRGCKRVALIKKAKPAWQRGKLNGIGGKLEPGESPLDAMVREFREETKATVTANEWRLFCVLEGGDWKVHFYTATGNYALAQYNIVTDDCGIERVEYISWYDVDPALTEHLIPNLHWIIPLALDTDVPVAFATQD